MVPFIRENADALTWMGLFFPFLISAFIKTAQGSSTVAMVVTASIMGPLMSTMGFDSHKFKGKIHLVAIGKAAWTMTEAAVEFLGERLERGIVVTKYEHSQGELPRIKIFEAGHPVADENTIIATRECINFVKELGADDELLFLVSGGGSALFEAPLEGITLEDLQDVTGQLLKSGADIVEINMVRKRFSAVKAGATRKLHFLAQRESRAWRMC